MAKTCGIYKITSPSGKIYIGQSIHVEKRLRVYRNMKSGRQTKLLHSLLKYGFEMHEIEIIHECHHTELNTWEKYFIDVYDTFNTNHGMNLKAGGHSGGTLSEESKAKLRKPRSPEVLQRIKENWSPRPPITEETREKHRRRMLGNKHLLGIRAVSKEIYAKDAEGIILKFLCVEDCSKVMNVDTSSLYKSITKNRVCKGIAFSYTLKGLDSVKPLPPLNISKRHPVYSKDKSGNVIKHVSISDCENFTKVDTGKIKKSAKDGRSSKGFWFSYTNKFLPDAGDGSKRIWSKWKTVYSKDTQGNINKYESVNSCSIATGVSDCAIKNAAKKNILSKGKYYFSFKPFDA